MKKVIYIFALFLAFSATAQDRPMHEVYSMMVFNFTKYVLTVMAKNIVNGEWIYFRFFYLF